MQRAAILAGTLALALIASNTHGQSPQLYRWVDENGTIHYSQSPPPNLREAHERLDRSGRRERIDRALTDDERAEKRAAEAEAREMEALKRRERHRLSRTYNNPDDVLRARDERLSGLESSLETTRNTLTLQRRQLRQVVHSAGNRERRGVQPSEREVANIESLRDQIEHNSGYIERREAERDVIKAEFDNELALYRALVLGENGEEDEEEAG